MPSMCFQETAGPGSRLSYTRIRYPMSQPLRAKRDFLIYGALAVVSFSIALGVISWRRMPHEMRAQDRQSQVLAGANVTTDSHANGAPGAASGVKGTSSQNTTWLGDRSGWAAPSDHASSPSDVRALSNRYANGRDPAALQEIKSAATSSRNPQVRGSAIAVLAGLARKSDDYNEILYILQRAETDEDRTVASRAKLALLTLRKEPR